MDEIFKNKDLLEQALTHKSWVNEHPGLRGSNERLEFLGDAVLEFIVSKEIYKQFPDKEEGYLTALRANLVNTVNLAKVAKMLQIGDKIYMSKGEIEGGGRDNRSILANTIEAVIGAIYLDRGVASCEEFIEKHLLFNLREILAEPLKDPKSLLQEQVQSQGYPAPRYEVIEETGPEHDKRFTIEVLVGGKQRGRGTGKNKSEAAQSAAKTALEKFS